MDGCDNGTVYRFLGGNGCDNGTAPGACGVGGCDNGTAQQDTTMAPTKTVTGRDDSASSDNNHTGVNGEKTKP